MIKTAAAAFMGLTMAGLAFGGAYAQDGAMKPSGGAMMTTKPAMMSDKDKATMKMCMEMSKDAMMKDQKCTDLQKMHPDAMKMQSGSMMKGAPAK